MSVAQIADASSSATQMVSMIGLSVTTNAQKSDSFAMNHAPLNTMNFGTDSTPVSAYIIGTVGGIVSRSSACTQGRLNGNGALWDGVPRFSSPKHNKIYNPRGEMPDCAAQALFNAGLINAPDVDAMWQALQRESHSCLMNGSASVSLDVSLAASALGKRGKGHTKTITPAAIEQRRLAGIASGFSRRLNKTPF